MITNNFKKLISEFLLGDESTGSGWSSPATFSFNIVDKTGETKSYSSQVNSTSATGSYACNGLFHALSRMGVNDENKSYIEVGTGTTTPTADDYNLESQDNNITVIPVGVATTGSNTRTYTVICDNQSDEDITITEIGWFIKTLYTTNTGTFDDFMLDRTVLSTPITIPAGQSKAITYEIGF